MPNLIQRLREFISSASPQRTLTILGSLLLLAAIPLTTYVAQQQQDIRQRAATPDQCQASCNPPYLECANWCEQQKATKMGQIQSEYDSCRYWCILPGCFSTCDSEKVSKETQANNDLNACAYTHQETGTPENDSCQVLYNRCYTPCLSSELPAAAPTTTPTPPPGCICQADDRWGPDYGSCGSQMGQTCTRNVCECQASGTYGPDYGACGSLLGQQCSSVPTNTPTPTPTGASGGQPTATPVSSSAPQATQPPASGGGGNGSCRDNPVTPPANHKWVASCSIACTQNSDCPRSTDTAFVDPATSNWCYGFGSVPADARCLKLEYTGSRIGATPIPTVPPDQATNCNPALLTMSLSPASPAIGASVTFNSAGTQGSTFIGDTWSGGVNCTGNFWGNKACSATTAGTFTWTHNWKNCAPNNCSITSTQCTKTLSFTIGTATSPTATATSIPGAINTPTATGVVASPTTPVAPGDVIFNFTLNLNAITTGRSLSTPQRNLAVELFNANGDKIVEKTGTNILAYNASSGKFSGAVNMGQVAVGNYTVKVKSNRYLRKRVPGIVTVPANTQQITIPETTLIVGDMNNDNIVNITDYNMLLSCFGEKSTSASCGTNKRNADLDDNNWVDEVDFNIYVRSLAIQSGD